MSRGGGSGNPLWNGLQAYYTADNTPNDALGTYNGTLVNGATYGAGIINQGFSLDGVDDYVDLGNNFNFDGSNPFSFNCWVNIGTLSNLGIIFSKGNVANLGYTLSRGFNVGNFDFTIGSSSANHIHVRSGGVLSIGTISMCTVTYNGNGLASGVKLYIDAVLQTKSILKDTFTGSAVNTDSAKIGAGTSLGGTQYRFLGGIDELSPFNNVLTQTEITELYNSGAGKQYPN